MSSLFLVYGYDGTLNVDMYRGAQINKTCEVRYAENLLSDRDVNSA